MQNLIRTVFIIVFMGFTLNSFASDSEQLTEQEKELEQVKMLLEKRIPSLKVGLISKSPVEGLYEVFADGQLLYVSDDAKFLFSGSIFSIENGVQNLSKRALSKIDSRLDLYRKEKLSSLDESDMVIFKAAEEKYKVTVFTDVDCGYCRMLHEEMPGYNKLGITVRYLGYPRSGIGSSSHTKLVSIWCSKDRNEAMNKAKGERTFGSDTCENPLVDHYKLVNEFRINGTPAIILASGQYLPGYSKPEQLLKLIIADELKIAKLEAKKSSEAR